MKSYLKALFIKGEKEEEILLQSHIVLHTDYELYLHQKSLSSTSCRKNGESSREDK